MGGVGVVKIVFMLVAFQKLRKEALSGPVSRDTPLSRYMGFLVSQHGQLGAIPPPPFLSVSPLEGMRSGLSQEVRYPPPPQKGYLRDT